MKRPITPQEPTVPKLLEGLAVPGFSEPQEFFEEILYQTPTNYDVALEDLKRKNPNPSQEDIVDYCYNQHSWEISFKENGMLGECYGSNPDHPKDFVSNAHAESGSDPISLTDILEKISSEDMEYVRVKGVAHYKGDYAWGDPGVCVYFLRKNPDYEAQLKANKEYKKEYSKYLTVIGNWQKEIDIYEKERSEKINAKIKEMEEKGEI